MTNIDLLDTQNMTASSDSVVGTHIPAPSPRQSTQSPVTHHLQQTLRNNASEQVRRYDSSSSACLNDSGDATSAFSAFGANNPLTIVETAQDGNSDNGNGWPEGEGLAGNHAGDDAQVNLIPRSSEACDETGMAYDSAVALTVNTASHTACHRCERSRSRGFCHKRRSSRKRKWYSARWVAKCVLRRRLGQRTTHCRQRC